MFLKFFYLSEVFAGAGTHGLRTGDSDLFFVGLFERNFDRAFSRPGDLRT
jgi:hypothetical protein